MRDLFQQTIALIDKHIVFVKSTISFFLLYAGILLYTYDRSFRKHQETILRVLSWNAREGIYCSEVHVGHDGTTLKFEAVPKEVGTAGPVDPSIMVPDDPTLSMDPIILPAVFLF